MPEGESALYRRTSAFFGYTLRPFFKWLLKFFLRMEVRGLENLRSVEDNIIMAPNHISEIDPGVVVGAIPIRHLRPPIYFVSLQKGEYKRRGWRGKYLYGGVLFKILGAFPAYRNLNNYQEALKNHIQILEKGGNICVFPEGQVTLDGNIQKAKGGLGFLSWRTKTPVLPIFIGGIYDMSFWEFISRKRKLKVVVGKPVYPSELFEEEPQRHEDFKKASQKVVDTIEKLGK